MQKGTKRTNHWHLYEVKMQNGDFVEIKTNLGECLENTALKRTIKFAESLGYVYNYNKNRWVHPTTFDTIELRFGKVRHEN